MRPPGANTGQARHTITGKGAGPGRPSTTVSAAAAPRVVAPEARAHQEAPTRGALSGGRYCLQSSDRTQGRPRMSGPGQ